jgi:uncharacterized LabA/DUF88 family protein
VIDAVDARDSWAVFVLFSGDGDFRDLITKLLGFGKEVHVYAFKRALSAEIADLAESDLVELYYLDDLREKLS